ncbi:hypothetical protein OS493_032121 [Desmophyllum pertusum]|uniref:Uncharacterized protein n=1 Tax=Desmophyllum pertusum TaxID=174260 RepID=A0A9W9YJL3_9CNID|nr:hypothetical protein OS493_032121 [Desmophyllum pertusum]
MTITSVLAPRMVSFDRRRKFYAVHLGGQSIWCYSCGVSEPNETGNSSCHARPKIKDCSSHPEFGEHFDSCFSQVVVVGGKTTIEIRECAMLLGCEELEGILCSEGNSVEDTEISSPQTCQVQCCEGNLCNRDLVSEVYVSSGRNFMSRSTTIVTTLSSSFVAVSCVLVGILMPW